MLELGQKWIWTHLSQQGENATNYPIASFGSQFLVALS